MISGVSTSRKSRSAKKRRMAARRVPRRRRLARRRPWSRPRRKASPLPPGKLLLDALDVLAGAGVDAQDVGVGHEQRHLDDRAGGQRAGLGGTAGGVAL